tara:strand:- start:9387 stop:10160 length:774 start_codon:yes stop_codon:yes gene_type:complete
MNNIHPSSLIDDSAILGDDITIGPFCTIGPNVKLGDGCKLTSHVVIERDTSIGKQNAFHPFCIIGMDPTDKKYQQQETTLEIGDGNTFRESVSVHRGTVEGGAVTMIGNDNLFMGYVHIAHDCIIGNHTVLANYVGLSGHVSINDYAILGGQVGVVQFLKIGSHAYIGGGSVIDKNVPPFSTGYGNRLEIKGVNIVGLKRRGFSRPEISAISDAHRLFFRSGLSEVEALRQIEAELGESKEVQEFTNFISEVGGKIR